MTNLSRIDSLPGDGNIARLAYDLRRQRGEIERQMRDAAASSGTTAALLERIEELRRRADELNARAAEPKR